MIYQPKEALIQFPSLWLPGSPLPSSRGLGRRCCCGVDCGRCNNPPESVTVDFVSGGWVDVTTCTNCEEVSGEIVVDDTSQCSPPNEICIAICRRESVTCPLTIQLFMVGSLGNWRFELNVFRGDSFAEYVTDFTSSTNCRSFFIGDPATMSMDKVDEGHPSNLCSGTLVDPIDVILN